MINVEGKLCSGGREVLVEGTLEHEQSQHNGLRCFVGEFTSHEPITDSPALLCIGNWIVSVNILSQRMETIELTNEAGMPTDIRTAKRYFISVRSCGFPLEFGEPADPQPDAVVERQGE